MKRIIVLIACIVAVLLLSGCIARLGVGQWQIYQSPLNARDQFLVDTATGDVYQLFTNEEGRAWWGLMEKGIPAKKGE